MSFEIFRRLRYRLIAGAWCKHPTWGSWVMIDTGMRQLRRCKSCGHVTFR